MSFFCCFLPEDVFLVHSHFHGASEFDGCHRCHPHPHLASQTTSKKHGCRAVFFFGTSDESQLPWICGRYIYIYISKKGCANSIIYNTSGFAKPPKWWGCFKTMTINKGLKHIDKFHLYLYWRGAHSSQSSRTSCSRPLLRMGMGTWMSVIPTDVLSYIQVTRIQHRHTYIYIP